MGEDVYEGLLERWFCFENGLIESQGRGDQNRSDVFPF